MSTTKNIILYTLEDCFLCNLMIKCLNKLNITYQITANDPEIQSFPSLRFFDNNKLTYEINGFTLETEQLIIDYIKNDY